MFKDYSLAASAEVERIELKIKNKKSERKLLLAFRNKTETV